jgi:hypothetical protein
MFEISNVSVNGGVLNFLRLYDIENPLLAPRKDERLSLRNRLQTSGAWL